MKKKIFAAAMVTAIALSLSACADEKLLADSAASASSDAMTVNYSNGLTAEGFYEDIDLNKYVTLPEGYMNYVFSEESVAPSEEDWTSFYDFVASAAGEKNVLEGTPAEDGKYVSIGFKGTIDGKEFTGGTADNVEFQMGAGQYLDEFETGIAGHKAGDSFTVDVTFPEGYGSTTDDEGNKILLDNTTVQFEITLDSVFEYDLSDEAISEYFVTINEELADGEKVENLDAMKQYFEKQQKEQNLKNAVVERLVSEAKVSEIPESIMEDYLEVEKEYIEYSAKMSGFSDVDEFLAIGGFESQEDYEEYVREGAEDYLKTQMVLLAAAQASNITYDAARCEDIFGSAEAELIATYGVGYVAQNALSYEVVEAMAAGATIESAAAASEPVSHS